MATPFDDLLPLVLPECPGAPEPLVLNQVRKAVREFIEKSTCYRHELPPMSTGPSYEISGSPGQYQLTPPIGSTIIGVLAPILFKKYPLGAKSVQWLDSYRVNWRAEESQKPIYFTRPASDILQIVPRVSQDELDTLTVTLILKPDMTAVDYPTEIHDLFADPIAALAKANILMMPGVDWSNPNLGLAYRNEADIGVQEAFSWITSGRQKVRADRNNRVLGHYF